MPNVTITAVLNRHTFNVMSLQATSFAGTPHVLSGNGDLYSIGPEIARYLLTQAMELADPGGSSSLVSLAKDAGTAGVDAPYHTELAGGYTPPCGVDFPTYVNALTDFLALMSALDTAIGTVGLRVSNIVPHVDALSLDVFLPSDIIITTILQSEV